MRCKIQASGAEKCAALGAICVVLIVASYGPLAVAQVTPGEIQTNSLGDHRITQLIEQLASDDSATRSEASRKLQEVKLQAAPALLALLADQSASPDWRGRAARVLSYGQPSVIEAITTFVEILKNKAQDPGVRRSAAWSLRFTIEINLVEVQLSAEPEKVLRPDTAYLLPLLVGLLEDTSESKQIRSEAAWALGGLGPEAHVAMPTLLVSIHDSESQVRAASVSAISDIGVEMPEVIPVLIEALHDGDENVRDWAAHALGKHKSKSDAIVAALREVLENDGASGVRQSCVMALTSIGPGTEGVVPALIFALHDEHDWVRGEAATALEKADPTTPEVVPALIAALDDSYAEVVGRVAQTLGKFGPAARNAIPALTRAILNNTSGPESYHGASFIDPLRTIGADTATLVTFLDEALNDEDAKVRGRAAGALAEIGAEGLPALAKALTAPGLLEEDELRWELSMIEYPLDTTPKLSSEELQALIGHYISERNRQAASTPDEPDRWADEQDALLYLATLEREQKASAVAAARDAAEMEKFPIPPTLLAFVAPFLVVLVLLAIRLHRRSRS